MPGWQQRLQQVQLRHPIHQVGTVDVISIQEACQTQWVASPIPCNPALRMQCLFQNHRHPVFQVAVDFLAAADLRGSPALNGGQATTMVALLVYFSAWIILLAGVITAAV